MICLFDNKAEKLDLIETNGDFILDPICTDAIITEELNGEYSLDADFIIDKKSHIDYDMICEDSLIKIDDEYGKEYFRIAKVTKTIRKITIFARHITISDILTMFCEDVRPEGQTGAGAISWIFDNASGKKWFNVSSDIPTLSTAYYVNKNVYEALFTADNSFLDRWGGETYRRGFNIAINQRVGADRGVQIRSKKNLTGFEASTNINSLITRIYPKGYNGITIDEKYIDSKYINNYSSIFAKEVKFEGVKVIEEGEEGEGYKTLAEAQNELKRLVNELYEVDKVDLITASYRINFVQLEKTEEYKNYSILERTWLGDTIEVIEDTLGINITVRVLKRKYDVIKGKRIETELSNKDTKEKPPTIQQVINKIEKLPTAENVLQIAKEQATAVINAGINGYVVANKNEILIMDTPDKNTAVKVWRWNVNGLGYSSTGYYGQYGLAMTMEGQIVADFITTGVLNANLIKSGVLSSFNGKTSINMEDGTFNFNDKLKMNEDGAIEFKGTITGSYADFRDTVLINGQGGNGWAQIGFRSSDGLEGNIYTGNERSINIFAPSGFYLGGGQMVITDESDKWRFWDTKGGVEKNITLNPVNGQISCSSAQLPLTLTSINGRVQTAVNFYVNGSCNPMENATGGMDLGAENLRWYTLYCVTSINTSDKRYKKNIKYLDCENTRTFSLETYKYYNFIKEDFKIAEYDYIRSDENRIEDHQIGFIANDIIDTEIGSKFCYELEEGLGFSATGYTTVIAKALQEAIKKIEILEEEIRLLKGV